MVKDGIILLQKLPKPNNFTLFHKGLMCRINYMLADNIIHSPQILQTPDLELPYNKC